MGNKGQPSLYYEKRSRSLNVEKPFFVSRFSRTMRGELISGSAAAFPMGHNEHLEERFDRLTRVYQE